MFNENVYTGQSFHFQRSIHQSRSPDIFKTVEICAKKTIEFELFVAVNLSFLGCQSAVVKNLGFVAAIRLLLDPYIGGRFMNADNYFTH